MRLDRILILLPHAKPVGGILKMLDYARHSVNLGFPTKVCFVNSSSDGFALSFPQFELLRTSPLFSYEFDVDFKPAKSDLVIFSLPTNFNLIQPHIGKSISLDQVVHVVQNTRHANPKWIGGTGRRLLRSSLSRICINEIVKNEVSHFVPPGSVLEVNDLAHDISFFTINHRINRLTQKKDARFPLQVGYTTWKSTLGNTIRSIAGSSDVEFKAIEGFVDWHQLREFYFSCDVFLAFPNEEEGMYLAGLEAMASGCFLITPMVKGNSRYAIPGVNCIEVNFEDKDSYVAAIDDLRNMDQFDATQILQNATEIALTFDLERERHGFYNFLSRYYPDLEAAKLTPKSSSEKG